MKFKSFIHMKNTLFATLLASLSLLLCVSTQAARHAKIVYFDFPGKTPEKVYVYNNSGGSTDVRLKHKALSESFKVAATTTQLAFLETSELPESAALKTAPRVKIPESWNNIIILAFADPSNKTYGIKLKAINADPSNFDAGQMLFINFTDSAFLGRMGEKEILVKPQSRFLLDMRNMREQNYRIKLDYVTDSKQEKPSYFLRKTWKNYIGQRQMMFLYKSANSDSHSYIFYPIRSFEMRDTAL